MSCRGNPAHGYGGELQPSPFRNTFVEIMKTGYGPCLMWSSCWHVRQMCAMRRKQSPALVTSNAAQPHSGPWDGLVGRADDTMRRGAVHFPELFGKLRLVVLQSLGCPRLEGWQAHLLWLSGAVCDDPWRIVVDTCDGICRPERTCAHARRHGTRRWRAHTASEGGLQGCSGTFAPGKHNVTHMGVRRAWRGTAGGSPRRSRRHRRTARSRRRVRTRS